MTGMCPASGCERPVERKGYCRNHLYRLQKYGDPLAGQPTPGTLPKWVEDHKDFAGNECLIWPFHRRPDGYGAWSYGGHGCAVHIFMCEHRNGPRPSPKHHAAHVCGNGRHGCVNPLHMEWKTPKENEADKRIHGSVALGERSGKTKLKSDDVLAIRKAVGKQREIAKLFGIGQSTVWSIKNRKTWGHLDGA